MAGIDFKSIAAAISCEDFARAHMTMQGGRSQCPFHGGRHFNLAYFRDGKCHCYKCGRTADSVQLASAVWATDQLTAARLLNAEFSLGIMDSSAPTAADRAKLEAQRAAREEQRDAERRTTNRAIDRFRDAERDLTRFEISDADSPGFTTALKRLGAAEMALYKCGGIT